MQRIHVIDSHTGGEPTRIIYAGGPALGDGPISDRQHRFLNEFDTTRSAVINEPRGNDVMVGGLICDPVDATSAAGIIFFNNLGFLGMCGHGTIGLMVTLAHLGKIRPGSHRIETAVGRVIAELKPDNGVSVQNVPSFRYRHDVQVDVPEYGCVVGDVAWGGNWFFLVKDSEENLAVGNANRLTQVCLRIREALQNAGITGAKSAWIDHIELFGPPVDPSNHSRNFVLCPGGAYDRSPCGTGTSAKLACLAAEKKLSPGECWRQESIVGSVFSGSYQLGEGDRIIPMITGSAYVCGETTLLIDPRDPFKMGIRH